MRRRLVLANLTLVAVLLVILEIPLALVYSRHEHDALNTSLQRDAASLAALSGEYIEHAGGSDVPGLAQRFSAAAQADVVIVDSSGAQLTRPGGISGRPGVRDSLRGARAGKPGGGEVDGLIYVAVPLGADSLGRGAVLVARSDESIDQRVRRMWWALGLVGVSVLALSLVLSLRLSRWVVNPLKRLDRHAAALGQGDLQARADTDGGPPEVVSLAITFNEMADRLDQLVTSQRRFVADASHQLRTPLTALRLRLENLRADDAEAVAVTRDAALDETSRLTRIVDGLLSLARAEGRRAERVPVDLASVLAERQEAWAPLAAENGIDLIVGANGAERPVATLIPGHLEQVLDNLIDNALDASEPGHVVELRVARVGATVEIHVVDEGRGMSPAELTRAFDPFWQSPATPSNGSTGLGLAIAEQLARACGATITLEGSPAGGIDAVIRLVS